MINGKVEFGEAQFYFQIADPNDDDKFIPYALVSLYGPPNAEMLEQSFWTLWACTYSGLNDLLIIPISSIISIVSMQTLPCLPEDLWFVVEKSGLDDTEVSGYVDLII